MIWNVTVLITTVFKENMNLVMIQPMATDKFPVEKTDNNAKQPTIFQEPGNESTALKKTISATAWCFSHDTFVLLIFYLHFHQF